MFDNLAITEFALKMIDELVAFELCEHPSKEFLRIYLKST
jgi:hypothetical protein